MTEAKKELIESYKRLCKDQRKKEQNKYWQIELIWTAIWLMVLVLSWLYILFKLDAQNVTPAVTIAFVFVISILAILFGFNFIQTKLFYREKAVSDKWLREFGEWLKAKETCTEQEIDNLLGWCSAVLDIQFPVNKLQNRMEKMLNAIVIPAVMSLVFKIDNAVTENDIKIQINSLIVVLVTLIGVLFFLVLPEIQIFGEKDVDIIKKLRLDLIEYKSFHRKSLYVNTALKDEKTEEK